MAFVALDGFAARLESSIKSSDTFLRLRKSSAAPLLAMQAGDYTWLVLRDRVNRELVKISDVANVVDVGQGMVDIPVSRLVVTGVAYNFPCHSVLLYEITSPVVREIVASYLAAKGIV